MAMPFPLLLMFRFPRRAQHAVAALPQENQKYFPN